MLPLWTGAIPVGVAYSVAAHEAGFTGLETQLMSVVVFTAATQISLVTLWGDDPRIWTLLLTALAFNVQALLLGVAVRRDTEWGLAERLGIATVFTEGAYAIAAAMGRVDKAVLAGAGVSMFLAWNLGTVLGSLVGRSIPDPEAVGLDLVTPLTFLALLIPLIRCRAALCAVVVAFSSSALLIQIAPLGVVLLAAGAAGGMAGRLARR